MSDDKITQFPIKHKKPTPEDRTLLSPHEVGKFGKCQHPSFVVDEALAEVECAVCKEKLNPVWVLARLASKDRRMHEASIRYREEMARLAERERTKCQHCGQITRISRR